MGDLGSNTRYGTNAMSSYSELFERIANSKDNSLRLAQSAILLSLLSACGGGGRQSVSGSADTGTTGTVIDGYVSAARVFRDANGDFILSGAETSVTTNADGFFFRSFWEMSVTLLLQIAIKV